MSLSFKKILQNQAQFSFIRREIDQALVVSGGGGWGFAEKREWVLY